MKPTMAVFQFSRYNIILVVFCIIFKRHLSDAFIDVARGIALFVLIGPLYLQLVYGVRTIADIYGASLSRDNPKFTEWLILTFGNLLWHITPLILIGMPQKIVSIFIAWALMLVWYVAFRSNMPDIYTELLSVREYDVLMLAICPGFALTLYFLFKAR